MPGYCTCGALLPPDARFCHKCGKPQYEFSVEEPEPQAVEVVAPPQPPPVPVTDISFANRSAVRAGFLAALIAVLLFVFPLPFPFLRLTGAFLAAGFFAVFLYTRRTGQKLSLRSGARIGWITGIFSFTMVTVQLTAGVLASGSEGGIAGVLKQQLPANDARSEQLLRSLQEPSALALMMVMVLFILFVLLTVLPTLGGLLGAKVFAREQ